MDPASIHFVDGSKQERRATLKEIRLMQLDAMQQMMDMERFQWANVGDDEDCQEQLFDKWLVNWSRAVEYTIRGDFLEKATGTVAGKRKLEIPDEMNVQVGDTEVVRTAIGHFGTTWALPRWREILFDEGMSGEQLEKILETLKTKGLVPYQVSNSLYESFPLARSLTDCFVLKSKPIQEQQFRKPFPSEM